MTDTVFTAILLYGFFVGAVAGITTAEEPLGAIPGIAAAGACGFLLFLSGFLA